MSVVNIKSDIGRLRRVIVNRPHNELLNLVPDYLEHQLFDDIPWLKVAEEEHDAFCKVMKDLGVEVNYIKDLVADICIDEGIKRELIDCFIAESKIYSDGKAQRVKDYMRDLPIKNMIDQMVSGLHKAEIPVRYNHLSDYLIDDYPFLIDPMPNMYFTRDPFSCVGNGVIMSKMFMEARSRESLFGEFLFKYHPQYKLTPKYYERNAKYSVEGGDVMVLDSQTLAIGISQRTSANAIEDIAKNILRNESGFKRVLAVDIPKLRTYMHLDTVFSMVDRDKFAIHPNIESQIKVYVIEDRDNRLEFWREDLPFGDVLKKYLQLDKVTLIHCGGKNYVNSAREQWNDGANTLAIAPGEVIVYARNQFTNQLFRDNGVKIHEIPCSELSRGRGGPHCMSMAVTRD